MNSELVNIVDRIKEKTSLEVAIFNEGGSLVAGDSKDKETACYTSEIISDIENNRTLFPIHYKNKDFVGRINGSSEVEKKFASLIMELISTVFIKDSGLSKTEFYKALIFGELSFSQSRRYVNKFSIPERSCSANLIVLENGNTEDIKPVVLNYVSNSRDIVITLDEKQCVFIKFDDSKNEYQSSTEYAEYLVQSIYEETGVVASIFIGGLVKNAYDLSASYSQAVSTARMSKENNAKGNVHSFKEYVLVKMLEDIPKYKLSEYLEKLYDVGSNEIFEDEEMIKTAEVFLENSLNISETSRKLYLHRNTLMYRLDKIEKMTGLDIRKFSDAVTFRLISTIARIVK